MRLDIVSVNVALPSVLLKWSGGEVISAIDKKPVAADEVLLTELNLDGDRQADTRPTPDGAQVHGGPDQAVYAFPSEHYPRLEQIVGRPLSWGFMGENLTVRGATEGDVCIGDEWKWGSARLQVSAPRGPCYKLGIRIGKQAMRTAIREEALVGWYLRVLTPGRVPTTGHITVERTDPSKVSVIECNKLSTTGPTPIPISRSILSPTSGSAPSTPQGATCRGEFPSLTGDSPTSACSGATFVHA